MQNYDFPNNCEDYIHRIGRTGVGATCRLLMYHELTLGLQRAGSTGTSYTYFTTDNAKAARELVGILREAKANVPPQLEEMTMYGGGGGGRGKHHALHLTQSMLTDECFAGRYGGGGRGRGGGGGGGRYGGGGGDSGYGQRSGGGGGGGRW